MGIIIIIIKSIRQIVEVVCLKVASFLDVLNNVSPMAITNLIHVMGV
jgi:hypothetical protein